MSSFKFCVVGFFWLVGWGLPQLNPVQAAVFLDNDKVTLIDGRSLDGQIRAIDENGQMHWDDGSSLPLNNVLSIRRPVQVMARAPDTMLVFLAHGGTLSALSAQLQNERVALRTGFGPVELPIEAIRSIVFKPLALNDPIRDSIAHPSNQFDIVWADAKDGPQAAEGLIRSIADEKLIGVFGGQERSVSQSKLIAFVAADLGLVPNSNAGLAQCQLADGSLLRGSIEKLADDRLSIRFPTGGHAEVPWSIVSEIAIESDRLVWLSDLSPLVDEQEPLVTNARPTRFDKSVDGNPLTLNAAGQKEPLVFSKGFGVHSYSRLVFRNGDGHDRLTAMVGIDPETNGHGECVFAVRGDGVELWSQSVRASDEPLPIDIDVTNVREISLIVEPGVGLDLADHANWCDARLLRTK